MVPKQTRTLLKPASLPLVPPPRVKAITVCARSKAISWRGLHKNNQTRRTSRSTATIVATDGVPNVPSKISVNVKLEWEEVDGGTNVSVAKRRWMIDRNVGGICRSTMSMAMVSYSGQERKTVRTKFRGPASR
jgi:hypothetical protein